MVKKGGAQMQPQTMLNNNSMGNFLNKTLKYCNAFGIFTNFIIIIVCLISIGFSWKASKDYIETKGKIISIENKSETELCKSASELKTEPGKKKERSHCVFTIEYTANAKKLTSSIDTSYSKDSYKKDQEINIYYNKNNHSDIKLITVGKVFLYICICILCLTVIGTILRMFFADNVIMKWWIGLQCFNTVTDIID